MAKTVPLIVVTSGNNYRRYVGKSVTDHVVSESPLTGAEVELFRKEPKFFKNEEESPIVA